MQANAENPTRPLGKSSLDLKVDRLTGKAQRRTVPSSEQVAKRSTQAGGPALPTASHRPRSVSSGQCWVAVVATDSRALEVTAQQQTARLW